MPEYFHIPEEECCHMVVEEDHRLVEEGHNLEVVYSLELDSQGEGRRLADADCLPPWPSSRFFLG